MIEQKEKRAVKLTGKKEKEIMTGNKEEGNNDRKTGWRKYDRKTGDE